MSWLIHTNPSFCEGRYESSFGRNWKNGTGHNAGRIASMSRAELGTSKGDGKKDMSER